MTSSQQQLLFVGSYAAADQPGVYGFHFDQAAGRLSLQGSFSGIASPSFLVVHPHQPWLYAVSETSQQHDGTSGGVWALRFDREPWAVHMLNSQPSGGDWPCHLLLDSSGRWLLVSNYGSGTIAVLPIGEDGSLGEATDLIQHQGSSVNPQRQEGPHAHSAALTPDGRFVVVADLGLDKLLVYALDQAAGKLNAQAHADARPGAGPRHIAFHPDGAHMYVANELDNTVSLYDYDASSGGLREVQAISTLPDGAPENAVADIHIAAAGRRLYVSNRGHNSIAVFDVDASGRLTRVAAPSCGGAWPRNFALAPGGGYLLAANQHSGDLSVLPLLPSAQAIGEASERVALPGASCVQFLR